jgi:hypothetical protein
MPEARMGMQKDMGMMIIGHKMRDYDRGAFSSIATEMATPRELLPPPLA